MQRSNEKLPHRSNLGPQLASLSLLFCLQARVPFNFSSTMASASTATQNVLGQVAAGGDSLRQSQYGDWNSLIYSGLRALVNLMPHAYESNQALNSMTLKSDLDELCGFTSVYLRKVQSEGHIKWRYLDAVMKVLGATRAGSLARFIPDVDPQTQFAASDSVLTLFNDSSGPTRPWETMWDENKQVWAKHIRKSHFAVRDSATITEICAGLQTILSQHDAAGGDPSAFVDHISFLSMMNDKRGDAEDTFRKIHDVLEEFAPGTVIIFGPADADLGGPIPRVQPAAQPG